MVGLKVARLGAMFVFASTGLIGCAESDAVKIAPHLVEAVRVSKLDPGSVCQPLGAIEGRSGDEDSDDAPYEAAYHALRSNAALRGANYAVIDSVGEPHYSGSGSYSTDVVIRGRIYNCALGMPHLQASIAPLPPPSYPNSVGTVALPPIDACR
jgi:hypothetical protein